MLYIEASTGRGQPVARVFSTKDSERELDNFRCHVHAPRSSLNLTPGRPHLSLFGKPREQALASVQSDRVFHTPIEREQWERVHALPHTLHTVTDHG